MSRKGRLLCGNAQLFATLSGAYVPERLSQVRERLSGTCAQLRCKVSETRATVRYAAKVRGTRARAKEESKGGPQLLVQSTQRLSSE